MGVPKDDIERRTKVGRLLDKYDLEGFGDELERMWTADGDERQSLRELADIFNKRILQSTIEGANINTVNTDFGDIYYRLQGEKGTSADQTRMRRSLKREGVDVDTLESDFLTYQAIRSYLTEVREAKFNPNENPIERDRKSIQQLRNRTISVTETKLDGLAKNDKIVLGPHEVMVDINVFCVDCGRQFDVIDILDQKGCGCEK